MILEVVASLRETVKLDEIEALPVDQVVGDVSPRQYLMAKSR
jgi:hypothetical protein